MSLLVKVLFAAKAKSTHHKMALDALPRLTCRDAASWQKVFLRYHDPYLVGAKAPDDRFKDFKNHVLHVKDGFWGGAPATALQWFGKTVTALRDQNWGDAAFCAGVLSHYVTDPIMPLHTGQSEAEGPVHRPVEWSITKSYQTLHDILVEELGGYPRVTVSDSADWLGDTLRAAAIVAHGSYESLIDRYNLSLGVDDPPTGLDRELQERIARLIGLATELFAQVLSRAIEESHQLAPPVDLTLDTLFASLNMPINWITKKISDVKDRMQVEAMYREFQRTGKVIERLAEDDQRVRELHASEVLGVSTNTLDPQPIRRIGALHGVPAIRPESATQIATAPLIRNPQPVTPKPSPVLQASASSAPSVTTDPSRTQIVPQTPPRQEPPVPASAIVAATLPSQIADTPRQPELPISFSNAALASQPVAPLPPPLPTPFAAPSDVESKVAPAAVSDLPTSSSVADSILAAAVDSLSPSSLPQIISSTTTAPQWPEQVKPTERLELPQRPTERSELSPKPIKDDEPRYYLDSDRPVVDAPSIGPKTAERLQQVGIETVADLLDCDPDAIAAQLDVRHISAKTINDWQAQAQLVCDVGGLRGHDAQILVACEIGNLDTLSVQNPATLLDRVKSFLATTEGERVLRGATCPDLAEVTDWIQSARRWPRRRAA